MKFNAKSMIVNHEGAEAFSLGAEMELFSAVASTFVGDAFYEHEDERLNRIQSLVRRVSPVFVAKLAVYARRQMNLRSIPLVLTIELAKIHQGDDLVARVVREVVQRPDEITELLAYYQSSNGRKGEKKLYSLSKQLHKGLAAAFNRFDEYQFAKYDRAGDVMLRDALFLVHPKAKDQTQQALFDKIARRELATPYTWETEISVLGQMGFDSPEARRAAIAAQWEALIDSQKIGYMALLRNLRNILQAGVSANHIRKVGEYLADPEAVRQSKQLPFRFLAAYRELKSIQTGSTPYLMDVLERALQQSTASLPGFDIDTRLVIACDVSGSMQKAVSARSKVLLYDIGLLMGMLLQSKCTHVLSGIFGNTWKTVALPTQGVLSNVDAWYAQEGSVGYATNGHLVIEDLIAKKYVADKVMMFTDIQLWNSQTGTDSVAKKWSAYKKIAPRARLYLFDLAGYGQAPLRVNGDDVYLIAGWSDKVWMTLQSMEKGAGALDQVKQIDL